MAFSILGINHRTAPVALREKVAFSEQRLLAALRTLRQETGVAEVVILSTCNRTEVYWAGSATGAELTQWLERHHGNSLDLSSSLYVHQERQAVEHAFSVASGLDSMVLGEAQILGQLKDAYRVAQEAGSTGPALNKLFQAAFSAAKRVRSETRIGENAVSIASATVSLARRVYSNLSAHTALMVGAGEMNALAARHFMSAGVKRMVIANRTLGRAQTLAAELKAYAVGLEDLDKELAQADIVITCTASAAPLITKSAAEAAIRARLRRPSFMVDLAVPRDIDPDVADLEVARFLTESRAHDAGPAIRALRQQGDGIRLQTLEQAHRLLAAGKSTDEVIEFLASTLTNRLLHAPTQALRQAAELADSALAEAITRLLIEERDRH